MIYSNSSLGNNVVYYTQGNDQYIPSGSGTEFYFSQGNGSYYPGNNNVYIIPDYNNYSIGGVGRSQPRFQLFRQGSGISNVEQQAIVNCAIQVYQSGAAPISKITAQAVQRTLGGDWVVIVYPEHKPIDFNMTCVQGNDYMYFALDGTAYQICRLQ